jgi:hypothetical protein
MTTGLQVSRLINVSVNLAPVGAQFANFNSLLIMGDSDVIDVGERIRSYNDISSIATDFGTTAPEYEAATLFFSQVPQPTQLYIGRWAQAATKGLLKGGVLTSDEQTLSTWTNITNGGVNFTIDGTARNLTGLDFHAQTNLNGVASVINTALSTHGSCVWDGEKFTVKSSTTGAGVAAHGTVTFTGNPTAGADTLTINSTVISFVSSLTTGNQVLVGSDSSETAANLFAFLEASEDAGLSALTYSRAGLVITATAKAIGTAGNAYTLVESSTTITVSGSGTFTGGVAPSTVAYATTGAGTNIAGLLKLTSTTASPPVAGADAETAVNAVVALDDLATPWYGLIVASENVTDNDHLAIAAYIQAGIHMYGVGTTSTTLLSSTVTDDVASRLKNGGYTRSCVQYSQIPYAIASLFGRAFTTDFTANNSVITLMYKQEPGVNPENLTASQADTLIAKRCNFFVNYNNGTAILQNGVMSGPAFFDEIQGTDALANAVQTNLWNALYTSPTKIPQTDAGTHQLVTVAEATCSAYLANGLLGAGTWTTGGFGTLKQGDFLPKGFYVYAAPVASQADADRAARKSVPIQIAAKLAGAIHSANVIINVNR